jgi:DNA-binding NtrC family response regulator
VPPLRDRRDDIPLLVAAFLNQRGADSGSVPEVSREVMDLLMAYAWPGNVRELRSVIESAVIRAQGSMLLPVHLPAEIMGTTPRHDRPAPALHVEPLQPEVAVSGDERQRLLNALRQAGGNRAAAARLLGIGSATLYRKLARLEIPPE